MYNVIKHTWGLKQVSKMYNVMKHTWGLKQVSKMYNVMKHTWGLKQVLLTGVVLTFKDEHSHL